MGVVRITRQSPVPAVGTVRVESFVVDASQWFGSVSHRHWFVRVVHDLGVYDGVRDAWSPRAVDVNVAVGVGDQVPHRARCSHRGEASSTVDDHF